MKKCMDIVDVISVLINGGHIVRSQPVVFGQTRYRVYLPGEKYDEYCGHISDVCAVKLWDMGYLVARHPPRTVGKDVLTIFVLDKPDISRFVSKSSGKPDDNK